MKAIVYTRYGPPEVLHLQEVEKPSPRDNEVLVKVHATTVTAGDVRMRRFKVPFWEWLPARMYLGLTKPKNPILGMELSGEIESVGNGVTRFRAGDQIFASTAFHGGYAEYTCLGENDELKTARFTAPKPANLSYGEAAAVPIGGLTALSFLRKANVQSGQKVLVYGASGSVGTYAVQLAKHFGAEVTGVCSAANLDLVRSLGAYKVIDYTKDDYSKSGPTYDVIFDAVGYTTTPQNKRAMKAGGAFVTIRGSAKKQAGDLALLKELAEAGKIKPVIDRIYSLEQIAEAHRYVEAGHKKGNVVVNFDNNSKSNGRGN